MKTEEEIREMFENIHKKSEYELTNMFPVSYFKNLAGSKELGKLIALNWVLENINDEEMLK